MPEKKEKFTDKPDETDQPNTAENTSPEPARSVRSDPSPEFPRQLRPSGGYRTLRSFQAATVIYDATFDFCERLLPKLSRMAEQMKPPAAGGRTSPRAAAMPPPPARPNCASSAWPWAAWMNSSSTTRISCASANCPPGSKMPPNLWQSAISAETGAGLQPIGPIRPIPSPMPPSTPGGSNPPTPPSSPMP